MHIGQWIMAQSQYANSMPPEHVRECFMSILPDELQLEVQRRSRDLPRLEHIINFVQEEIVRQNEKRLAETHHQRQQQILF